MSLECQVTLPVSGVWQVITASSPEEPCQKLLETQSPGEEEAVPVLVLLRHTGHDGGRPRESLDLQPSRPNVEVTHVCEEE